MSIYTLIALAFLLLTIFGCVSIFDSYASTKQAEAVIETNQTVQLALGGQIAMSILLTLTVVILTLVILILLYHFSKKRPNPSQYPMNRFSQDDFSTSSNMDAPYQFPVLSDEKEKETSILPSGWGW